MSYSNGALLVLLFLSFAVWKVTTRSKTPAPLPPGPPADPIIGHARIVPSERAELCYQKWAKEYNSDVIYLNLMGKPLVILNSAQSAIDLMDKRGGIYSDRPDFPFYAESGWKDSIAFMSTGAEFRKHRKIFQNAFSPTNIVQYRDKQEALAKALVSQILRRSDQWREFIHRFASAIILSIGYGIQLTEEKDDPYFIITEKVGWFFANGGPPGGTLVDIIPILRYLPSWVKIFPSLNFARKSQPIIGEFYDAPFASVKRDMASGGPEISFVRSMLEELANPSDDTGQITEDDIKGVAATLFSAGADTTYTTIHIFVLCMVLNPEVQEKARKELDQVIGRDRLPILSDRGKLPYIDRIVHETMRWHPSVTLGVPHRSSKDDIYKGLFIPKKSIIMANAYAILHDPQVYANPEAFNPDRYASEPLPVGHFGFGRRICPGQYLATASVWIAIATILATLKISKTLDSAGKEITPVPKWISGLGSHPEDFPCVVEPRDEQAIRLIQKAI